MRLLFLAIYLALTGYAYASMPTLINGSVVDRRDYPEIIWIGGCTATLVGERTVATAAHCVRNGGTAGFSLGSDKYSSKCRHSRHYRGNSTADYAFCYTDRAVTGVEFASINIDPAYVSVGDTILQTGFGCTRWGTGLDGQLRVGKSEVLQTPSGSSNDYVTGNGAVLCSGDSGGPAYGLNPDGTRGLLISVNSRSNTTSRSYLSALATAHGIEFIESFADEFDAKICGLAADAKNCRGVKVEPMDFELTNSATHLKVHVAPGKLLAEKVKQALIEVGF